MEEIKKIQSTLKKLVGEREVSKEQMMKMLIQKFPKMWVKDGNDFEEGHGGIWTGEGSDIDVPINLPDESEELFEIPLFDYYGEEPTYIMGVHHELEDFLTENGWMAEAYDGGTYFLYPNY